MVLQKPWVSLKFSLSLTNSQCRFLARYVLLESRFFFFAKLSHTLDIFAMCLEVPICL